jgi:hypothetical protein
MTPAHIASACEIVASGSVTGNPHTFNGRQKKRLCCGHEPLFRRHAAKAHVGSLVIVLPHPFGCEVLHVCKIVQVVL